jgi:hypothetical protein
MRDLDKEAIIQSTDFLYVLSELNSSPLPSTEEVLTGAEKFREYYSTSEDELNDFALNHVKTHIFEALNRGDISSTEVSINTLIEMSVEARNKINILTNLWVQKYPQDENPKM